MFISGHSFFEQSNNASERINPNSRNVSHGRSKQMFN
jgi:hypothetical protein